MTASRTAADDYIDLADAKKVYHLCLDRAEASGPVMRFVWRMTARGWARRHETIKRRIAETSRLPLAAMTTEWHLWHLEKGDRDA